MRIVNRNTLWPRAAFVAAALALGACGSSPVSVPSVPAAVKPYRIDIQQGNFISPEMVAQLKPGMTKEQVRYVLGTPLVTDIFHADRWDYVYYRDPREGKREQRTLSVLFEGGKLVRVIADVLPGEAGEAAAKAAATKPPAPEPRPAAAAAKPEPPKPAAPEAKKTDAPAAEAEKAAAPEEKKADAEAAPASERGFFGRMLEKIGF